MPDTATGEHFAVTLMKRLPALIQKNNLSGIECHERC